MENNARKIENLQNAHVALWLLKDCAWCQLWKETGIVMVAPTLLMACWIAWDSRRSLADLIHNLAVCLWIIANVTWMAGEFFYHDGTRGTAKIFFFSGLALLAGYYLYELILRARSSPD